MKEAGGALLNEMRGRRESLSFWPVTVVFDGHVLIGKEPASGRPACMEFRNIEEAEAFLADSGMEAAGPRVLGHVFVYGGCGGRARISFVPACKR